MLENLITGFCMLLGFTILVSGATLFAMDVWLEVKEHQKRKKFDMHFESAIKD